MGKAENSQICQIKPHIPEQLMDQRRNQRIIFFLNLKQTWKHSIPKLMGCRKFPYRKEVYSHDYLH